MDGRRTEIWQTRRGLNAAVWPVCAAGRWFQESFLTRPGCQPPCVGSAGGRPNHDISVSAVSRPVIFRSFGFLGSLGLLISGRVLASFGASEAAHGFFKVPLALQSRVLVIW